MACAPPASLSLLSCCPIVTGGMTKARRTLAVHLSIVLATADHPSLPKLHPRTKNFKKAMHVKNKRKKPCMFLPPTGHHPGPLLTGLHVLGSLPWAATFSHMKMTSNLHHQFQFQTRISNSPLNTNALGSSHFIHYGPFPKFIALGMATLSPDTQMRQQDLSGALSSFPTHFY